MYVNSTSIKIDHLDITPFNLNNLNITWLKFLYYYSKRGIAQKSIRKKSLNLFTNIAGKQNKNLAGYQREQKNGIRNYGIIITASKLSKEILFEVVHKQRITEVSLDKNTVASRALSFTVTPTS